MKIVLKPVYFLISAIVIGCSTNPDVPPRFRLHNGATDKASVQIKTTGGNTVNINGVDTGYVFAYQNGSYTINVNNPPSITITNP